MHLSHRDCTAVTTVINRRTTIIASVYLDYHQEVIQPWLEAIMDYRKAKGYALLLAIDSNSHSQLYGNVTNSRGKAIEDFIANHRLELHNNGLTPTFHTLHGQSIIDITLSKLLSVSVKNWWVDTSYNASDHNTISYELRTELNDKTPIRQSVSYTHLTLPTKA